MDEAVRLERPALLLGDAAPPLSEVQSLAATSRAAGRPLAVVAPPMDGALADALDALGASVFEAVDRPGEPAADLIRDLAVYAGAVCLTRDLGWGSEPAGEYAPLVVPQVGASLAEAGSARWLDYVPGRLTIEASAPAPAAYTSHLATLAAVDDQEAAGLRSRLARLGVPSAEIRREAAPSFERSEHTLHVPAGYASPYLVTDAARMEARLVRPSVVVLERKVDAAADMAALLRPTLRGGPPHPLLIVAPALAAEAVALLVVNKLRGIVQAAAVAVADDGWRTAIADIAQASPAPLAFDADGQCGAVEAAVCGPRSLVLTRLAV